MKVIDGEHDPVERLLVEQRPPGRREQDARHPGDDHDREDRLRAGVDVDLVVVPERDEDLGRARQRCAARAATSAAHAPARRRSRRAPRRRRPRRASEASRSSGERSAPRVSPVVLDMRDCVGDDTSLHGLQRRERGGQEVLRRVRHRAHARLPARAAPRIAPTAKFCGECGAALSSRQPQVADPASPAAPTAERRLVSVLFADLVGFTTASEGRDAEDTRELLTRYFDTSRTIIERYGGTVEKFIGDAVMAVWGAPVANEDDAERAVRAALELVDAIPGLDPALQARAGVLTGEAAVSLGATDQGMVAGDLVNTAARIQSRRRAGHRPRRRGDAAGNRVGDRLRRRRHARVEGQERAGARSGGRSGSPRSGAAWAAPRGSRRRSSAGRRSCDS